MSAPAGSRGVRAGIGLAVAALVLAAVGANVAAASQDSVKQHPAPALFRPEQLATLAPELAAQKAVADRAFAAWSTAHPTRDDAAFRAFALAQLPPVPGPEVQQRELAELRELARGRTPDGDAAARWLEVYGKKDLWKLYLRDATELSPASGRRHAKDVFKADTALAKSLTATAQQRAGRSAPTVVDPSLRPGAARKAKLSYPSKHAVYVFSELALLDALDAGRSADFRHAAEEVAFSRLYAAGHYRSDLVAGALLGDLLGDYEVRTLRSG